MTNNNEIPELCFLAIQKGDSQSIAELKYALETHGFFSIIIPIIINVNFLLQQPFGNVNVYSEDFF